MDGRMINGWMGDKVMGRLLFGAVQHDEEDGCVQESCLWLFPAMEALI